jgi:hypothetical protein
VLKGHNQTNMPLSLTHSNELSKDNSDLELLSLLQMKKKDNRVCHQLSVIDICHLAIQCPHNGYPNAREYLIDLRQMKDLQLKGQLNMTFSLWKTGSTM